VHAPPARALGRAEKERAPVVFDLRGLGFIDLGGLAAIAKAPKSARDAGRRLVCILGVAGPARRLFELTGLVSEVEVREGLRGRDEPGVASRLASA